MYSSQGISELVFGLFWSKKLEFVSSFWVGFNISEIWFIQIIQIIQILDVNNFNFFALSQFQRGRLRIGGGLGHVRGGAEPFGTQPGSWTVATSGWLDVAWSWWNLQIFWGKTPKKQDFKFVNWRWSFYLSLWNSSVFEITGFSESAPCVFLAKRHFDLFSFLTMGMRTLSKLSSALRSANSPAISRSLREGGSSFSSKSAWTSVLTQLRATFLSWTASTGQTKITIYQDSNQETIQNIINQDLNKFLSQPPIFGQIFLSLNKTAATWWPGNLHTPCQVSTMKCLFGRQFCGSHSGA